VDFVKKLDFQDGTSMMQVRTFAYSNYSSLIESLFSSINDPVATRITIQNLIFLMHINKPGRRSYPATPKFILWARSRDNPLYSLKAVEGLLIVNDDDPTADLFAPEVQQFILYINRDLWPLREELGPRVINRLHSLWDGKSEDGPPAFPFGEPIGRWFSDHESEHSDEDEGDDGEGFLGIGEGDDTEGSDDLHDALDEYARFINDNAVEGDTELLDDEPDTITVGDMMAYFSATEEAGLASRERRLNARNRAQLE
jgi:hypothetical protein